MGQLHMDPVREDLLAGEVGAAHATDGDRMDDMAVDSEDAGIWSKDQCRGNIGS